MREKPLRQVILIPDETGGYTVEVPSLPGGIGEGDTVEEALANIKEAIDLYIEVLIEDGFEAPAAQFIRLGDNSLTLPDSFPC